MSGEQARADRLQRLLAVQTRKREMEEWRLADLKREATALADTSVAILQSLGDQSLLQGLFLEAKASSLRRNEVQIAVNIVSQEASAESLRGAQRIEKRLENACDEATGAASRAGERTALDLVLDDYLAASRASFE